MFSITAKLYVISLSWEPRRADGGHEAVGDGPPKRLLGLARLGLLQGADLPLEASRQRRLLLRRGPLLRNLALRLRRVGLRARREGGELLPQRGVAGAILRELR